MKRDMDLCRQILQAVEDTEDQYVKVIEITIGDTSRDTTRGHVSLLLDEGLLAGQSHVYTDRVPIPRSVSDDHNPTYVRLTSSGHDLVEASRESATWNMLKETAAKVPGFTFDMALPVLKAYGIQKLKEIGIHLPGSD